MRYADLPVRTPDIKIQQICKTNSTFKASYTFLCEMFHHSYIVESVCYHIIITNR